MRYPPLKILSPGRGMHSTGGGDVLGVFGGESGIRTHEGVLSLTHFRDEHVQPLRHLPVVTSSIITLWATCSKGANRIGCGVFPSS